MQAFRAVDGAADGFDSEEEIRETAEERHVPTRSSSHWAACLPHRCTVASNSLPCAARRSYERLHPDVPVVRNYEDMWMVAKVQRMKEMAEQRAAWAAERDAQRAKAAASAAETAAPGDGQGEAPHGDDARAPAGAEDAAAAAQ